MEKLGWIGLGAMGTLMAKNLADAGFDLAVYNRNRDRTEPFQNSMVKICGSIVDLVQQCDVIFTMVSNDSAVKAVYDEILGSDSIQDKLFIDMSTISEKRSMATAVSLAKRDAHFIDAPVAGSTEPAREGTLIILAGGAAGQIERARPYFDILGKSVLHFGPNGKGIVAKLCINYFISLLYLGLAETILLAERNGIDRSAILDMINMSTAGSVATKLKTPLLNNKDYAPQFAMELMLKDIGLVVDQGMDLPLSQTLHDTFAKATEAGWGQKDVIAVLEFLEQGRITES